MTELWRTIPKYDNYEASDSGLVRNKTTGKILKNSLPNKHCSPIVSLVREGKTHVLETRFVIVCTFWGIDIDARPKPKIIHKDGDGCNVALSNLEIHDASSNKNEVWRPVVDFEDTYAVSNLGRVKRLAHVDYYIRKDTGEPVERHVNDKILKFGSKDEYYELNLRSGDKSVFRTVHKMVATAFVENPNPEYLTQVNHKDGNKHNNNADNLEWVSPAENIHHAIETGLRGPQSGIDRSVKQIRCVTTGEIFNSLKEAAAAYDLSYNYLSDTIEAHKPCRGLLFEKIVIDRRVKCLDTGEVFGTAADAEKAMHVSHIDYAIQNRTCLNGWTFAYMRDNIEDEQAYLEECRNRYSQWPRANKRWLKDSNEHKGKKLSFIQAAIMKEDNGLEE